MGSWQTCLLSAADTADTAEIVLRLSEVAPVTAVRGNVDEGTAFPESAMLHIRGWRILVTHIMGVPPKGLWRPAPCWGQHCCMGTELHAAPLTQHTELKVAADG